MNPEVIKACDELATQARAVLEQFNAAQEELSVAQQARDLAKLEAQNLMVEAEKVSKDAINGAIEEGRKAVVDLADTRAEMFQLDTLIVGKKDELAAVQAQLADALARLDETRTQTLDFIAKGDAAAQKIADAHDALASNGLPPPAVPSPFAERTTIVEIESPVIEPAPPIVLPETPPIVIVDAAPSSTEPAPPPDGTAPVPPVSTEPPAGTPLTPEELAQVAGTPAMTDEELERLTAPGTPTAASSTVGGL